MRDSGSYDGSMMFKDYIRERREAAGFSRQKLADLCKMHWTTIQKVETGVREPSISTLKAIGEALEGTQGAFSTELRERLGIAALVPVTV